MASANSMIIAAEAIGIITLILMFFDFGSRQPKKREIDDNIFTIVLFINIGLLASDMITWILTGKQFYGSREINIASTAIYYVLQPAICFFWLMYCDYKLTEDKERIVKLSPLYAMPATIAIIFSVASCFVPIFFFVDAQNIYHRGPYYLVFVGLCTIYYLWTSVITLRDLKSAKTGSEKERDIFLLVYPIFPLIAAVIQSLFFGVSIIWLSSIVALLVLYANVQNSKITTDSLTSLNNRRRFASYVEQKIKNRNSMDLLFILLIDIDRFKEINDEYGHLEGDNAIRSTASILVNSVGRDDFVARIGGDEFVVVGERLDEASIKLAIYEIRKEVERFNRKSEKYTISVSIGCGLLKRGETKTYEQVFAEADRLMYQEKKLKHS